MTITDLQDIRALKLDIEVCQERIARMRSSAESATATLKAAPGRSTAEHDRLSAQLAQILDYEFKLIDRLVQYESLLDAISIGLKELPPALCIVLTLRFVEGLKWKEVAEKSNYSYDYCKELFRSFKSSH